MGMVKTHSTQQEKLHKPEVIITSEGATVNCTNFCQECQFSIADTLGRIIKKGVISDKSEISFQDIPTGFYQLIIFNAFDRYTFPLNIK
jgi:hypothetical protein